MSRIQTQAVEIEWRRMADHDTYYPLRDGPRHYRARWCIDTMSRYLPPDHVHLARMLADKQARVEGRGRGEIAERVQGGDNGAGREFRLAKMALTIRELTGYGAASLRVGLDGYACFRGVVLGDSQAELARRCRYPQGSVRALRRLVQLTMEALAEHQQGAGLGR